MAQGARRAAARVAPEALAAFARAFFPARLEPRGRFRRDQPETRDAREHRAVGIEGENVRDAAREAPGATREPPIADRARRGADAREHRAQLLRRTRLILPGRAGRLPEASLLGFPEGVAGHGALL